MRSWKPLLLPATVAALFALAAPVAAEDYGPFKTMNTSLGKVLVDAKGMTVYTYDKDSPGKSDCYGECATFWPPVKATATDKAVGGLTMIKRTDGSLQWADDGKPLYTYVDDKKPGDVTGDSKNWHVVKEK